jgi:hypothetical protein
MATLQDIQVKAATDHEFRGRLLADPRQALAGEGVETPDQVDIAAVEATAERWVIVVPPALERELDEADLAKIAGGQANVTVGNLYVSGPSLDLRPPAP